MAKNPFTTLSNTARTPFGEGMNPNSNGQTHAVYNTRNIKNVSQALRFNSLIHVVNNNKKKKKKRKNEVIRVCQQ